jgi:heme exporter protein A
MNELTADNLHVWRGEQHVLQGVQFSVGAGRCLQIIGSNGSGKTTLLRVLCGLIPLEEGRVRWCGADINTDPENYGRNMSYLGHEHGLKADLTAVENLRYAVALRRPVSGDEVAAALSRVGLPGAGTQHVRHLSAGQRRRVALARMTLMGGALWIMDEPGSNLDTQGQELISGLLQRYLDEGGIAVVATHQALGLPATHLQSLSLQ